MSIIESKYRAPLLFRNKHFATIIPSMYRKVQVEFERERLELEDGDFIDIDWLGRDRDRVIILTHGLEGNSQRHYITGIADYFFKKGWGVAAWNCRSCSGEMNRLPRLYSHIDAPDLADVVDHIAKTRCTKVAVAGISMGGAITLNYMAKFQGRHPEKLIGAVAISAPVDVLASSRQLDAPGNKFYQNRFLKKMLTRAARKEKQFPGIINPEQLDTVRNFKEYDDLFTVDLTQCTDIDDFYKRAASLNHLSDISTPTLLLLSADDPFMPDSCYPYEIAKDHEYFDMEVTMHGGHTGFMLNFLKDSWMERRSFEFINGLG